MSALAIAGASAASIAGHAIAATGAKRLRVVRRTRRVREDPPYVGHYSVTTQHLIEQTIVMDRVVWTREIDREEIDQNVVIELGCFGASEWRSRFADVIAVQRAEAAAIKENKN